MERLHREVNRAAVAGGGIVELPRVRFRERDELLHRLHRHGRMHDEDVVRRCEQPHGREALHRVERKLLIERGARGKRGIGEEQRVAVRRGARHGFGPDDRAAAGAVLDDELRAQALAVFLRREPCHDVDAAAGRVGDDHADGLGRVLLGLDVRPAKRGSESREQAGLVELHSLPGFDRAIYSILMPAALMRRSFSMISRRTSASNSSTLIGYGSAPIFAKRSFVSGVDSTFTVSRLTR